MRPLFEGPHPLLKHFQKIGFGDSSLPFTNSASLKASKLARQTPVPHRFAALLTLPQSLVLYCRHLITRLLKMRSRLNAQMCHFLRLTAWDPDFCDKKCRILKFCNKTELHLIVLQQNSSLWRSLSLSLSLSRY